MSQILSLLLLFFVHVSAQAAWPIDSEYLRVPPPPESGSVREERDFAILMKYQELRTPVECKIANSQSIPIMKTLFGAGTRTLTREEFEAVESFGDEIIQTVSKAIDPFKEHWQRRRPYDVNPEIEPCIRKPGGARSYPSSHAAVGVVLGDVLSKIYPEKRMLLKKQGMQIGKNRVLGGVHHPSDIEAGRILGIQIRNQLMKNPSFLEYLTRF